MNKKIILLLCLMCPGLLPAQQYSGLVKYINVPEKGTVVVESTGFGRGKAESDLNAGATALYTLLFRGLPGSVYDLPMVPDETEKKDHPVVKELLDGGYSAFVTENFVKYEEKRKKKADGPKGILTVHTITFNCDALRRYLEQHAVIRKFGY